MMDLSLQSGQRHMYTLCSESDSRVVEATHVGNLPTDSRPGPTPSHGRVLGQMWLWLRLHKKKKKVLLQEIDAFKKKTGAEQ